MTNRRGDVEARQLGIEVRLHRRGRGVVVADLVGQRPVPEAAHQHAPVRQLAPVDEAGVGVHRAARDRVGAGLSRQHLPPHRIDGDPGVELAHVAIGGQYHGSGSELTSSGVDADPGRPRLDAGHLDAVGDGGGCHRCDRRHRLDRLELAVDCVEEPSQPAAVGPPGPRQTVLGEQRRRPLQRGRLLR